MLKTIEQIKIFCDSTVVQGPFKDLHVNFVDYWGPEDVALKWLGTYEQPIFPYIERELTQSHDIFINVGCGDGYYGAGIKKRNPEISISLFDINPQCKELVDSICVKNNITDYKFSSICSPETISADVRKAINPWLFVDIEGHEVDLLNINIIPELSRATITVEIHDCFRFGTTNELLARFQNTHTVTNIVDTFERKIPPLPSSIILEKDMLDFIRHERRGHRMNWLHMIPLR